MNTLPKKVKMIRVALIEHEFKLTDEFDKCLVGLRELCLSDPTLLQSLNS